MDCDPSLLNTDLELSSTLSSFSVVFDTLGPSLEDTLCSCGPSLEVTFSDLLLLFSLLDSLGDDELESFLDDLAAGSAEDLSINN